MQLKCSFYILILISLCFPHVLQAQNAVNSNLTNEEIERMIDNANVNPTKRWELINFYINKSKKEINKLSKDLRRKDAALAETAALLVLRKKAQAIWGDDGDE